MLFYSQTLNNTMVQCPRRNTGKCYEDTEMHERNNNLLYCSTKRICQYHVSITLNGKKTVLMRRKLR